MDNLELKRIKSNFELEVMAAIQAEITALEKVHKVSVSSIVIKLDTLPELATCSKHIVSDVLANIET